MKKIIVTVLLLWATVAYAQFNGCPPGFCNLTASGGGPPPTTPSLDFSDANNSMYIPLIGGFR